jgi:hypothetical protein
MGAGSPSPLRRLPRTGRGLPRAAPATRGAGATWIGPARWATIVGILPRSGANRCGSFYSPQRASTFPPQLAGEGRVGACAAPASVRLSRPRGAIAPVRGGRTDGPPGRGLFRLIQPAPYGRRPKRGPNLVHAASHRSGRGGTAIAISSAICYAGAGAEPDACGVPGARPGSCRVYAPSDPNAFCGRNACAHTLTCRRQSAGRHSDCQPAVGSSSVDSDRRCLAVNRYRPNGNRELRVQLRRW